MILDIIAWTAFLIVHVIIAIIALFCVITCRR